MRTLRALPTTLMILLGSLPASAASGPVPLFVDTSLPLTFVSDREKIRVEVPVPKKPGEPPQKKFVLVDEDLGPLTREVSSVVEKIERFCADTALNCRSLDRVHVHFTIAPPKLNGVAHGGLIDSTSGNIWVHRNSSTGIVSALFHELAHWAHFGRMKARGQKPGELAPWIQEAIPHLASLIYRGTHTLSAAEARYLQENLSGSLLLTSISRSDPQWFGLVDLWTRYLHHLALDPLELLSVWVKLDGGQPFLFESFRIQGESVNPIEPARKSFVNLFTYFAVALHANMNSSEIDPWGLYSLGLSYENLANRVADSRVSTLPADQCVDLQPMEFRYFWAQPLAQAREIKKPSDLRAILWTRQGPVILKNTPQGIKFSDWDRLILVNTSLQHRKFCLSQAPGQK